MVTDPTAEQQWSYTVTVSPQPDGTFVAVCEELEIEGPGDTPDEAIDAVASAIARDLALGTDRAAS